MKTKKKKKKSGTEVFFEPHMWDSCLFGNVQNMTMTIAILEHDIWDSVFFGSTHLGQWVFLNHTSIIIIHLGQLPHIYFKRKFNEAPGAGRAAAAAAAVSRSSRPRPRPIHFDSIFIKWIPFRFHFYSQKVILCFSVSIVWKFAVNCKRVNLVQ